MHDKNPVTYFLMFILGNLLCINPKYQESLDRDKWTYGLIGTAFSIITLHHEGGIWNIFFLKIAAMTLIFAMLGISHCYLNHQNKVAKQISKISFSLYLIHMLVLTAVSYILIHITPQMHPLLQGIIVFTVTLIICFALILLNENIFQKSSQNKRCYSIAQDKVLKNNK